MVFCFRSTSAERIVSEACLLCGPHIETYGAKAFGGQGIREILKVNAVVWG